MAASKGNGLRLEGVAEAEAVERLLDRHARVDRPRLELLWSYYRNAMRCPGGSRRWFGSSSGGGCGGGGGGLLGARGSWGGGRAYAMAQAAGLPDRLRGVDAGSSRALLDDRLRGALAGSAAEVVIENDIAWRVHTMVEFMFGKPIEFVSTARDARLRGLIERVLDAVWEASGGIVLMQDAGLLGNVFGHVDFLVRPTPGGGGGDGFALAGTVVGGGDSDERDERAESVAREAAGAVRVEAVDARRGFGVLSDSDFRRLEGYVLRYRRGMIGGGGGGDEGCWREPDAQRRAGLLERIVGRRDVLGSSAGGGGVVVTELISGGVWRVYEDSGDGPVLVGERSTGLGDSSIPVAHVQNLSQPFMYGGLSEVEPLIPLQDELNTRLSDRARRVTMQSFNMYLAKGIEGFADVPVGPGQVWSTDNVDASIESFGGDAESPSEERHIEEIREALDKQSGVPPLATGVVKAKVGNLSSENALRLTLTGLLSRTARKQVTYGRGISEVCRLVLGMLDEAGILETDPVDRGVRVRWPEPLPVSESDRLNVAKLKTELGVDRERVLGELGYVDGVAEGGGVEPVA